MTDSKDLRSSGEDRALVDVYTSFNPVEAELIRDILLDNEIDCFVRNLQPPQFPLNVGKHGGVRITVPQERAINARNILQEAIDEGALSGEGSFMEE